MHTKYFLLVYTGFGFRSLGDNTVAVFLFLLISLGLNSFIDKS